MSFLLALSILSLATLIEDTLLFDRYRFWLLGFNVATLGFFLVLTITNVISLLRQRARNVPSSRLTLKLVRQFLPVVLVPASVLYLFSYWALDRGIKSWFNVEMGAAFDDALELGRHALDEQMQRHRQEIEPLLGQLEDVSDDMTGFVLSSLLEQSLANELMLVTSKGRIISSASKDLDKPLPERIPENSLLEAKINEPYMSLDTITEKGLYARLVFLLPLPDTFSEVRYLQALFPMSDKVNHLGNSIQKAYQLYNRLAYQRSALKQNFIFVLNMVLLLSLLYALWLAFRSSHNLMRPVVQLSDATRSIAAGNLNVRLDVSQHDDLGFLVQSFSTMAHHLAVARKESDDRQKQIENQRMTLSAIIENVLSGVLALNKDFRLITANRAAGNILGTEFEPLMNRPLCEPDCPAPLRLLFDQFPEDKQQWQTGWESEFRLVTANEQKTIACYGASMPSAGYVIVFNDVSQLVRVQRDSVWREATQKFAHEIKNPLTPIRLSAERLQHKLNECLDKSHRLFLDDAVNVIVQQVEAMRRLVDDMRNYARSVPAELVAVNLNRVVNDVVALYRANMEVTFHLDLNESNPPVLGDESQIRQLLHNLIKNALEAMSGQNEQRINVKTHTTGERVYLTVTDNGPGFADEVKAGMFEPHVTGKPGGSGLGLAVVRRIVTTHKGEIHVENRNTGALVQVGFCAVTFVR